ncbi:glycosyltransferase [Micromonospora sp. R77]|nr:glycosyltransferase [Micromonospora sp. R77]MCI4065257.1 glycosyltransferase [Micromonospora sp. R77]
MVLGPIVRSIRYLAREALHLPDPQAGWIVPALRAFRRTGPGWTPDVILATGPPFSVFVVAAALARRHGAPWVADYRDLWTVGNEYWAHGRSRLRRLLDHRLERRLLRTVSRCVTVSEPLARSVRAAFGVRTDVVMNGIDRQPTTPAGGAARAALGVPPGTLLLAHTGLLYPGRRDPTPLLRALSLLGAERQQVHVVLAGPETGVAGAAVTRCGVAELVSVTGRVTAAESWQLQAEADVLVLLMWDDPRDAGTVPGKLFDYLRARRPILAIGCADGVAADLVRSRGAGVVLNDPVEIADRLRTWLTEKRTTGQVAALPGSALDGLYREDRMRAYVELLGAVVAARR